MLLLWVLVFCTQANFLKYFFVKKHERRATIIYDYVYEEKMNVFIFFEKKRR